MIILETFKNWDTYITYKFSPFVFRQKIFFSNGKILHIYDTKNIGFKVINAQVSYE